MFGSNADTIGSAVLWKSLFAEALLGSACSISNSFPQVSHIRATAYCTPAEARPRQDKSMMLTLRQKPTCKRKNGIDLSPLCPPTLLDLSPTLIALNARSTGE